MPRFVVRSLRHIHARANLCLRARHAKKGTGATCKTLPHWSTRPSASHSSLRISIQRFTSATGKSGFPLLRPLHAIKAGKIHGICLPWPNLAIAARRAPEFAPSSTSLRDLQSTTQRYNSGRRFRAARLWSKAASWSSWASTTHLGARNVSQVPHSPAKSGGLPMAARGPFERGHASDRHVIDRTTVGRCLLAALGHAIVAD